MRIGFLAALLSLSFPPSSFAESSFPALAASAGWRGAVTGRVTFDRKKAAAGGWILAAPSFTRKDYDAARISEALLATEGGSLGYAAALARELGISLLVLEQASWDREGGNPVMILEEPIYASEPSQAFGLEYRVAERSRQVRIGEGAVVMVDPQRADVTVYAHEEKMSRLAGAEALRAYDGLKDAQSLVQWYEGASEDPSEQARLAVVLEEGMARRLIDGGARPEDFRKLRTAVLKSARAQAVLRDGEKALWALRLRESQSYFKDLEARLKTCATRQAALRLGALAKTRWERISALGKVLGKESDLKALRESYRRAASLSSSRLKEIGPQASGGLEAVVAVGGARLPARVELKAGLYRRFLEGNALSARIARLSEDSSRDLRRKSADIRALIRQAPLARDSALGREIEALAPASWTALTLAGSHEARLTQRSDWPQALKEVWAALWSPQALGERKRERRPLGDEEAAVFAQEVIAAQVSGAVLSRSANADARRLVAFASEEPWEDAAGARDATAIADQYILDSGGREIYPARLGIAGRRLLNIEQLERLARLCAGLEDHYGTALELRYGFKDQELFVLQVRRL